MKATIFADPYKQCVTCGGWVDGFEPVAGTTVLVPCGHAQYRDVCTSWSPVTGCGCDEYNARHPDDPIIHARRTPGDGDERPY